jgi:curved DNA-binding protein CbpA
LNKPFSADDSGRRPRLVPGCDLRSLPIGPQEAFLLSRIDGSVTESELVMMTGLSASSVESVVTRLLQLGAIVLDGEPPQREAPTLETRHRFAAPEAVSPSPAAPAPAQPTAPNAGDDVDLSAEQRTRVLEFFQKLDTVDHYALLGVAPEADKKEIRRAYYAVAPDFHPDRFFGKKMGAFKAKMEAIFGRLTLAYETLGSKEARVEYDAYLASQQQTRHMERLLAGSQPSMAPRVPSPAPAPVPSTAPARHPTPSSVDIIAAGLRPPPPPAASPPPKPTPVPSSVPPRTPEDERARREALARKLAGGRGSLPPAPHRISTPPASSRAISEAAAQDLKRRHDAILSENRRGQVARYVEAAKTALAQNNIAAAANAYRLAASMDPENTEIQKAYQETSKLATSVLADGYLKQAEYEARAGNWTAASKSYVRAALGMPDDAAVLNKAAAALLKASGDLHQAVDFAKRAATLSPKRPEPHLTLVELYLAANMPLLAKRAWEAARELAPQDARMTELGKRLK